ncbi:MAG: PAS domain-containing sensor histidine kinase [Bacillota bacterium]
MKIGNDYSKIFPQERILSLKIAGIYIFAAYIWIFFADDFRWIYLRELSVFQKFHKLAGVIFIVMTGIILYYIVLKNIEAILRLRDEMEARKEANKIIIENISDGIWEWEVDTGEAYFSPRFLKNLGYKENELDNHFDTWRNLIHDQDADKVLQKLKLYLERVISQFEVEFRMKMKDGEIRWFLVRGKATWNENGEAAKMVGTQTDITDRKEAEELLKKMMEENGKLLQHAIEYDRLKTEFFSNISHEFKTPLNVILGTVQLLTVQHCTHKNCPNYETMCKYIKIMRQNCYRLLRLMNNLIDITKIDSGYMQLELGNYNIIEIVEDITLSVAEFIEQKSITLEFDTDIEEKMMACDPNKIERIMLNLLSNAVKHTGAGGRIEVAMENQEDSIRISVKDTGVGIPEDKQEIIFERFRQADNLLNRSHEGSGIGLSMVKSLVEMHQGSIRVNSEVGKGSEFIIELPCKIIVENEMPHKKEGFRQQENVEKIHIEFSDIYS